MAMEKTAKIKTRKIAGIASIVMVFFLTAAFVFETLNLNINVEYYLIGIIAILTLIVIISMIRTSANHKLAFNVPFVILIFYTLLTTISGWQTGHYLLVCLVLCAVSCLYLNFNRTAIFIIVNQLLIMILILSGYPVSGQNTAVPAVYINWAVYLSASVVMLMVTRIATVHLDKALEHKNSFMSLLATTENYVAIIDEYNRIVYASKTLAKLGNIEEHTLVQGRPLLDLFPGRSLKVYAGKLLKNKDSYTDDWEFSLEGEKQYFKAASHRLAGVSGGTLISLYDMTHLAERDEIAVMKDNMKIGLFFMDKNYVIQDHYSRYLEEMLMTTKLVEKAFTDIIIDSVTAAEMGTIKDFFKMVIEHAYDQEMLDEINPLDELHYIKKDTKQKKVLQFAFAPVERGGGETFILTTVYDITVKIELQNRLAEEESRRQEEMQSVFEFLQVQPNVFNDFMDDMEYEFDIIEQTEKDEILSNHEVLVKIYQSVHAVKSNAVVLGLNTFGKKLHNLESKIKKLRELEGEVPFADMLDVTMDVEKMFHEKEGFAEIIEKFQAYTNIAVDTKQQSKALIDSLAKTSARAAEDQEKLIKFIADDIDDEAVEKCPRRVVKEILVQLVRNSAIHGIETPDSRRAKGKNETGTIKLAIRMSEDKNKVTVNFSDDGNGLDYKKISEKALKGKLINEDEAANKDLLIKAIFAPGFSTAETEGMYAGRGIGLNLVRDRLKNVNGSIKLRSEDGKGIHFLITVPVQRVMQ